MPLTGSDIQFVFSGGASNNNPSLSLGGSPSAYPLSKNINNLFDDVAESESQNGHTDFRCFYIFNNHSTDSFYGTKLWVDSQTAGGANIEIGLNLTNEVQTLTVVGPVNSGSLTLNYGSSSFTFGHSPTLSTWAANFQTAINNLPQLSGVVVTAGQFGSTVVFEVRFTGDDGNRFHPLLTLTSNGLIPGPVVTIAKVLNGSPINSIASTVEADTSAPNGIVFSLPEFTTPLNLGVLKPTEGFPVWVKRVTAPATVPVANDGFKLRYRGSPIP